MVKKVAFYPLTHSQKGIWYTEQFFPETAINNIAGLLKLDGSINYVVLEQSINLCIENNNALRLRIVLDKKGEPKQYLREYQYYTIDMFDHTSMNDEDIQLWANKETRSPMRIIDSDLFYIAMVKLGPAQGGFYIKTHHLISDAWTMILLGNQIVENYYRLINNQEVLGFRPSYLDRIKAEQQYMGSVDYAESKQYWNQKFSPLPELFTSVPHGPSGNIVAKRKESTISEGRSHLINQFCREKSLSGFVFFLSLLAIYLARITGKSDVIIGTPILNRYDNKDKATMGMFIDTIPIRLTVHEDMDFETFACYVKGEWEEMKSHLYPYDLILNDVREKHNTKELLYDITLSYQKAKFNIQKNYTTIWYFNGYQANSLVINISDRDNTGKINLEIDYRVDVYSDSDINSFENRLLILADNIIRAPQKQLYEVEILSEEEKHRLIYELNPNPAEYSLDKTVDVLFEEQAEKTPEKVAIIFNEKSLTFQELNQKANQVAYKLREKKVRPDDIVGIMEPRSIEMIICMLGVLKAGGSYIPIDPLLPQELRHFMLEDSGTRLILTSDMGIGEKIPDGVEAIGVSAIVNEDLTCANLEHLTEPNNLAYVLYTSGSTGLPKGVLIQHRSVVNYIKAIEKILTFSSQEIVLSVSALSFDMFINETLVPLCLGTCIVMASETQTRDPFLLADLIKITGVTKIMTTPLVVQALSKLVPHCLSQVSEIMLGGDEVPPELLTSLKEITSAEIVNGYGPTETTMGTTFGKLNDFIHIGRPILNAQVFIVSTNGRLQPIGIPGELCISGQGLARGYLNRPNLTDEKFIANPFIPGTRMYKTGDLARWLPDGNIEFLGRIDRQVKIRGFRVELGEIETQLRKFPGINDAAVIDRTDKEDTKYLCAYIVCDFKPSIVEIREFLSNHLSEYMIPSFFMVIDKLPLTSNGKLDRAALPEPDGSILIGTGFVAPRNDIESQMASVWSQILGVQKIGIQNDFFTLGGDSLKALRVMAKLLPYGWDLTARDFYEHRTIERLAQKIQGSMLIESVVANEFIVPRNGRETLQDVNLSGDRLALESVLLTGASGFLGAHLLNELIDSSEATIYCLVRGENRDHAEQRLVTVLDTYFSEKHRDLFGKRIFVLDGDVSKEKLGLTDSTYHELGCSVNTVIHAAALVKHLGHWEDFQLINVQGTQNVIKLCTEFNVHLNYISTISVSGQYLLDNFDFDGEFTENDLYIGQNYMENLYVRSKFEAENLVFKAIDSGIQASIFRIGILTGRYKDGYFQVNIEENAFYNRLKALVSIGVVPKTWLKELIEFTPVDLCTKTLVQLIQIPETRGKVFHIMNNQTIPLSKVLREFRNKGYSVVPVSQTDFQDYIRNAIIGKDSEQALVWLVNELGLDGESGVSYSQMVKIRSDLSQEYLRQIGIKWPQIDSKYLKKIIDHMIARGYLSRQALS